MFNMFKKTKKHSPLKDSFLHYPGQSLNEKLDIIISEKAVIYLLAPIVCIVIFAMDWYRWYSKSPPTPYLYLFVIITVSVFSFIKLRKLLLEARNYNLGRQGELTVGLELELLMLPYKVILHDIASSKGNIDHLLITSSGMYTIETKTWRKLPTSKITSTGTNFFVDGKKIDDFLKQPLAEAAFIKNLLKTKLERDIYIQPTLLFPGWFIEQSAIDHAKKEGVWLLNPKMLELNIKNEPVTLTEKEISEIAKVIATYVKNKKKSNP